MRGTIENAQLKSLYLEMDSTPCGAGAGRQKGEARGGGGAFASQRDLRRLSQGLTTLQGAGVSLFGCGKGQAFSGRPVLLTETVPGYPGEGRAQGGRPLEALELQVALRLGRWEP